MKENLESEENLKNSENLEIKENLENFDIKENYIFYEININVLVKLFIFNSFSRTLDKFKTLVQYKTSACIKLISFLSTHFIAYRHVSLVIVLVDVALFRKT